MSEAISNDFPDTDLDEVLAKHSDYLVDFMEEVWYDIKNEIMAGE